MSSQNVRKNQTADRKGANANIQFLEMCKLVIFQAHLYHPVPSKETKYRDKRWSATPDHPLVGWNKRSFSFGRLH